VHAYNEVGTSANFSVTGDVTAGDFAAGDLVDAGLDPASPYYCQMFAQLKPEAGAQRGPQLAYVRAFSVELY
jgi:hypothetical protein